jgi:hypothetical protein
VGAVAINKAARSCRALRCESNETIRRKSDNEPYSDWHKLVADPPVIGKLAPYLPPRLPDLGFSCIRDPSSEKMQKQLRCLQYTFFHVSFREYAFTAVCTVYRTMNSTIEPWNSLGSTARPSDVNNILLFGGKCAFTPMIGKEKQVKLRYDNLYISWKSCR